MLRRKTPQADLENKRSAWRALGFVASLALILSALAWTSYDVAITRALDFEADLLEDEEIPVNVVTPPPPPPPPQQTTVIEIVDDEEEIEEELEIEDIELDEDNRKALVLVDEDQLSLGIGRKGQNVRLASKLTHWDIDIMTRAQLEQAIADEDAAINAEVGAESETDEAPASEGETGAADAVAGDGAVAESAEVATATETTTAATSQDGEQVTEPTDDQSSAGDA